MVYFHQSCLLHFDLESIFLAGLILQPTGMLVFRANVRGSGAAA